MFESFRLENLFNWLSNNGVRVLVVLVVAFLVDLLSRLIFGRAIAKIVEKTKFTGEDETERIRRGKTVRNVFEKTITASVIILAIVVVLHEVGLPITSLLVGAGVLGIIIGLGAQSLMKDLINGIFILTEDQYDIGDEVEIKGVTGKVKEFNLRRTVLTSLDHKIEYTIPNSKIDIVSNKSKFD